MEDVSTGRLTTGRFAAAVMLLLAALTGALWAFDLIDASSAGERFGETLVVAVIFMLASLAVVALTRPKRPG